MFLGCLSENGMQKRKKEQRMGAIIWLNFIVFHLLSPQQETRSKNGGNHMTKLYCFSVNLLSPLQETRLNQLPVES